MNITTLEQAEQYAAAQGVLLTPTDRARIAQIQAAERQRLEAAAPAGRTFADRWNAFYPRLLQMIVSLGETLLTFAQTLIVNLGVPLVLVLLLVVEHQRVVHGIMLFEADAALASFAAAALVMLNLVLEFQTHYVEHRAGYEQARALRWSLRIWLQNMAYRLGIGDAWQEQQLSPAQRYRRLLGLVTFSILALALAGSMRTVIEQQPGAWYEAIISIVTESNLGMMMTWAGGLLFAAAAVLSAQGLSRYVAIRCVEILGNMQQTAASDPHAAAVDQAGATAALALIQEKLERRRAKEAEKARPFLVTEPPATDEDTAPAEPARS